MGAEGWWEPWRIEAVVERFGRRGAAASRPALPGAAAKAPGGRP
jgi:hypothetical protein